MCAGGWGGGIHLLRLQSTDTKGRPVYIAMCFPQPSMNAFLIRSGRAMVV